MQQPVVRIFMEPLKPKARRSFLAAPFGRGRATRRGPSHRFGVEGFTVTIPTGLQALNMNSSDPKPYN